MVRVTNSDQRGQAAIIRIFEHAPVSRRKDSLYKVKFKTLANDENEKYYAYTSQEINNLLDRWHYYNVLFNNNPKNPRFKNVEEVTEDELLDQCE